MEAFNLTIPRPAPGGFQPEMPVKGESLLNLPSGKQDAPRLRIGAAEDGSPVLLSLHDANLGPILVAGDRGCGKTTILKQLAVTSSHPENADLQFGVVTPFDEEWCTLEAQPGCLGIWQAYHLAASAFLERLISWAQVLHKTRQTVLLLFDGLEILAASGYKLGQDLRWLLEHGPEHHILPLVTVDPGRFNRLDPWLSLFQTRILGTVASPFSARLLADERGGELACLAPGAQFILRNNKQWLRFSLDPAVEHTKGIFGRFS